MTNERQTRQGRVPDFFREIAKETVDRVKRSEAALSYVEPDIDFVDPKKLNEYLGKRWRLAHIDPKDYQYNFREGTRVLSMHVPKIANGEFSLGINISGPYIKIYNVNSVEMHPEVHALIVESDDSHLSIGLDSLSAILQSKGKSRTVVEINYGRDLKRNTLK